MIIACIARAKCLRFAELPCICEMHFSKASLICWLAPCAARIMKDIYFTVKLAFYLILAYFLNRCHISFNLSFPMERKSYDNLDILIFLPFDSSLLDSENIKLLWNVVNMLYFNNFLLYWLLTIYFVEEIFPLALDF